MTDADSTRLIAKDWHIAHMGFNGSDRRISSGIFRVKSLQLIGSAQCAGEFSFPARITYAKIAMTKLSSEAFTFSL